MALLRDPTVPIPDTVGPPIESRAWARLKDPVAVFVVLSALFGLAILLINPPLRGPDEAAHFLRIYGIAQGDIVPATTDEKGRKGVFLPAALREDFRWFEDARYQAENPGFTYHRVFSDYWRRLEARAPTEAAAPVFELYEGAESYSPTSYWPYIPAMWIGRALGLDFATLSYLLRLAGFVVTTAIAAYAIALTPHLRWAFLTIAMLPASLYGRAVISADGMTLSALLLVTALCLRGAAGLETRTGTRAFWMLVCTLTKPPQIAFILLEAMVRPLRELPRRWLALCVVCLPGLIFTVLWITSVQADVGTWRVIDGVQRTAADFDPVRKIRLLIANPLHFPMIIAFNIADQWYEHWRQLIGIFGWLDTPLRAWVYPVLSLLLCASLVAPLPLARAARTRVATIAGLSAFGYWFAVYTALYLTWTPIDAPGVWGVQGRYFIVMLPLIAIVVAALVNRGSEPAMRAIALCAAILAGLASIEAVWRVSWSG